MPLTMTADPTPPATAGPVASPGPICSCCRKALSVADRADAVAARCFLTPVARDTLAMILQFQAANGGLSPTLQELSELAGVTKTSMHSRVGLMQRKGAISRAKHAARSIKVLEVA